MTNENFSNNVPFAGELTGRLGQFDLNVLNRFKTLLPIIPHLERLQYPALRFLVPERMNSEYQLVDYSLPKNRHLVDLVVDPGFNGQVRHSRRSPLIDEFSLWPFTSSYDSDIRQSVYEALALRLSKRKNSGANPMMQNTFESHIISIDLGYYSSFDQRIQTARVPLSIEDYRKRNPSKTHNPAERKIQMWAFTLSLLDNTMFDGRDLKQEPMYLMKTEVNHTGKTVISKIFKIYPGGVLNLGRQQLGEPDNTIIASEQIIVRYDTSGEKFTFFNQGQNAFVTKGYGWMSVEPSPNDAFKF